MFFFNLFLPTHVCLYAARFKKRIATFLFLGRATQWLLHGWQNGAKENQKRFGLSHLLHIEKNTLLHFKSIFWLLKHWMSSMNSLVMKPMEIVLLCFSAINTWWFDRSYWYIHFIVSELSSFSTLRQWLAFKAINRFQEFLFKSQREQSLLNSKVCHCWWLPLPSLCSPLNSCTAFVCSRSHWSIDLADFQSVHLVASYLPLQPEPEDF